MSVGRAARRTKFGTLELGRFAAAMLVVLTHLLPDVNSHAAVPGRGIFGGVLSPGALGVQYFFVLSGFVMASAHYRDFGKFASVPKFFWRRACRIYPVYWLALCIPVYYLHGFLSPWFSAQLFTLAPWANGDFIAPAWSLRYEMAFYLAFGLCLMPYLGKPVLAIWVFAAFWRWCPASGLHLLHLPPPFMLNRLAAFGFDKFLSFLDYYFFAGLLAGWTFEALRPRVLASLALAAGGAVLLLLALPVIGWGREFASPMAGSGIALAFSGIILGLAGLERHGTLHCGKAAGSLGAISYPLYILHAPLLLLADQTLGWLKLGRIGLYLLFIAGLAGILGISTAITFLFDQKVQRWLRHVTSWFAERQRGVPQVEAAP